MRIERKAGMRGDAGEGLCDKGGRTVPSWVGLGRRTECELNGECDNLILGECGLKSCVLLSGR